ncbi:MAG TPA: AraC family transcriptional regulator, partial [Steroidobacteraceae bacterium]
MDALSELLRAVKLSGAVFYKSSCSAPWHLNAPPSTQFLPYIRARATHVIEFHHITEGTAFVQVGGETTPLAPGDIVMIPHGDAHVMGAGTGGQPIDGDVALPALWSGKLALANFGGGGEVTGLVCGYLACDGELIKPVLAGLPRVLRVNIRNDPSGDWLDNTLRHALAQAAAHSPGSDVILAHMAEVLFTEVLRRYLLTLPAGRTGWLAGAGDPAVGRALAALHREPAHNWTLDSLAQEAGLSRSALTERFTRFLGQSPMAYLADWRLELGAEALRSTSRSVQRVAVDVGYDSEAAFNRAFKRRFSVPPARYRRESRGKEQARLAAPARQNVR